jgi:PAS domain S-box-containing protein
MARGVRDRDGRIQHYEGFFADVTHRRVAEQALLESHRNMEALLNATTKVVLLYDIEGTILAVNEKSAAYFDLAVEDVLGRDISEFLPPEVDAKRRERLEHIRRTRSPMRFREEQGGRIMDVSIYPVLDAQGNVARVAAYASDVTDQARMEASALQSQKLEAVGTLASGIAHEFNNILGIIFGFTEMARLEAPEDSPHRDNLDEIFKATLRAKEVVRQMLTYAKGDEKPKKSMDIVPVVRDGLSLVRASLPASVAIRTFLPESLPRVLANPTQIQQVLINLCKNAADALPGNQGRIDVALEAVENDARDGERVRLKVTDNGSGMEPMVLEKALDPFFTTKGPGLGTGMGLAVVHGIMQSHGGEVEVDSRPGRGTAVSTVFPVAREGANGESGIEYQPKPGKGERILLVDDEPDFARVVARMLESGGYHVRAENDPRSALRVFRENPYDFDLVLTDQAMPRLTGLDLARHVRALRRDIPIMLCTGYTEPVLPGDFRQAGVETVITKPFLVNDLLLEVGRMLCGALSEAG